MACFGAAIHENLFDLSGKVALVTGAARGLGKAAAVGPAAFGAGVTLAFEPVQHGEADRLRGLLERGRVQHAADVCGVHRAVHGRASPL
jgi:NAD(P)-dependent dehydrogenase (short-subunit alcohol dehydrogenase family)